VNSRARLVLRVVLLAIVVFVVGRRYLFPPDSHPPTQPAAAAAIAAAAKTQQLRMGSVVFTSCEIGHRETGMGSLATAAAFCSSFDVPEDWDAPQGRHIHLHVALVKSGAAHPPTDLVTYLDGGPGGAATETYPAIASALAPLKDKRDILLIDQRGTGGSNPLRCDQQKNEDKSAVRDIARGVAMVRQCLDYLRTYSDPQHYTTTDANRDLEAVRQALGAPLLNVIGISYGTRAAQQYAGHYPNAIRSVVLDSTVPNALVLGSEHARNLEAALRAEFALCTQNQRCSQNFGDSYKTLYRLRDHLRGHPEEVAMRDPNSFEPTRLTMSAPDLAGIVRIYLYSPLTASLLPLMLHEADHGNYEPLLGQKKLIADSLGAEISGGMELSVLCSEDADLLSARPEDADTLMGNAMVERIKEACSVWPTGGRPADFHNPWTSAAPVLVLAGQYDPVTPPGYGEEVVKTLSHSRLLLVRGQGHSVIGAGCMPKLVSQFIDDLQPSKLDAGCLEELGATPAFVDFNGPPP
jgi:pimeloyl-ACP methyl ester carboxylesterase